MREKYDTFYTVYFQNQEMQNFFYSMPGSGEDTSKLENSLWNLYNDFRDFLLLKNLETIIFETDRFIHSFTH